MTLPRWLFSGLLLTTGLGLSVPAFASSKKKTGVVINRVELRPQQLARLNAIVGQGIPPGRYWYDRRCGAWGYEGHGAAGIMQAGLKFGGRLRANASRGRTGAFVNGRQLAKSDVKALQAMGIPVYPGRYWLDADGTGGVEGGPAMFNLLAIARSHKPQRRRSIFSSYDLTGVAVMGDGQGVYVLGKDGSSASSAP